MNKNFFFFLIIALSTLAFSQGIGELVVEKEPMKFPPRTLGLDIIFTEGGFGLGGFWRKDVTDDFTFFSDFSISEAKDEKEFEYVDYFGNVYVFGKKNRIFLLPFNAGLQYRVFTGVLTENLRPYINFGVGPSIVVTTPYEHEFFTSFKFARARYTAGGYIGMGANFGLDQKNVIGLSLRYYIIRFFDEGIESLHNRYQKELGGFFLTINLGSMY